MNELSPPPFAVKDFVYQWKNWLSNLYDYVTYKGAFINAVGLTIADSPYTVLSDEAWLLCDPVGGSITLNLPEGQHLRTYGIKNYAATGSNTVTLIPDGLETIEGATSYVVAKGSSVLIVFSESKSSWYTI